MGADLRPSPFAEGAPQPFPERANFVPSVVPCWCRAIPPDLTRRAPMGETCEMCGGETHDDGASWWVDFSGTGREMLVCWVCCPPDIDLD